MYIIFVAIYITAIGTFNVILILKQSIWTLFAAVMLVGT